MATKSTISVIRWDDCNKAITLRSNGNPVNLTGSVIFFTVKDKNKIKADNDDTYIIKKDITEHIDAEAGKTALILTNTDTKVPTWIYIYDFQIKTSGWEIHSTLKGEFIVLEDVTKRTSI